MEAVFVHDHMFHSGPGGGIYTGGKLPYVAFTRYLRAFDSLRVVGRVAAVADSAGLTRADGPNVTFSWLPNDLYRRPGWHALREADRVLRNIITPSRAVIVRLPSIAGVLASRQAIRVGAPWAAEVVGCPWEALLTHGSRRAKLLAAPLALMTRYTVGRASHALYVTDAFLQRRYPCGGLTCVASNVEVEAIPEEELEALLTARRGRGKVELRIGVIASLNAKYKGLETAFRALRSARDRLGRTVSFEILGGGDVAPWRRLAESFDVGAQVRFIGTLPQGAPVRGWLGTLDLYVQPSLTEGLPRALVEAMSLGLPCLASSVGGIPELLDSECLHAPGDHRHMGDLVVRAARDLTWCEDVARRNHRVAQRFARAQLDERRTRFWREFAAHASVLTER